MSSTFRCIYSLLMGRLDDSVRWGQKAADAFTALPEDHVLELALIDVSVYVLEALRRQGRPVAALKTLVLNQTKVFFDELRVCCHRCVCARVCARASVCGMPVVCCLCTGRCGRWLRL